MSCDRKHDIGAAVDAFGLLSHETRMAAMYVLWEAERPLQFSEIADRAGISDTGNFNYHFGKLVGTYVRDGSATYELTRSGRQVMTAVAAGELTQLPELEPVKLGGAGCPYCTGLIELCHGEDTLRVRCRSCPGTFEPGRETPHGTANPRGTISTFSFPPSGLQGRTPEAILNVALVRHLSRYRQMTAGTCPECAGSIERSTTICPTHDQNGICRSCSTRFAGQITFQCRTCRLSSTGLLAPVCVAEPRVQAAFDEHGYDLLTPSWETLVAFLDVDDHVSDDASEYKLRWAFGRKELIVDLADTGTITEIVHREV